MILNPHEYAQCVAKNQFCQRLELKGNTIIDNCSDIVCSFVFEECTYAKVEEYFSQPRNRKYKYRLPTSEEIFELYLTRETIYKLRKDAEKPCFQIHTWVKNEGKEELEILNIWNGQTYNRKTYGFVNYPALVLVHKLK